MTHASAPGRANAIGTRRPVWGPPYPDVSGSAILVPCNLALYADDGSLLGVAGADMRLDDVVARLTMDELPGFIEAFLLGTDGTIIAHSQAAGGPIDRGLNDNRPVDRRPYPHAPVREAVVRGESGGTVFDDPLLHVFHRTAASGWTLVVQVERQAWMRGP